MAQAQIFDTKGKDAGSLDLPESVFGITPHKAVMHEVLVAQLAGRRLGTHWTKTRSEVSGSTRKIYRQKGTGRARHGSRKAPLFRGGGITFGPKPRDYAQDTPKRVRRLALRSALSAKAADGKVVIVEQFQIEAPKAKAVVEVIDRLPVAGKTLIVTPATDAILARSAANLPGIKVAAAGGLNLHEVMAADYIVFTRPAVDVVVEVLGR